MKPTHDGALTVTDGRLHGPEGETATFISIEAVNVGVEVGEIDPPSEGMASTVDDCRPIADRLAARMYAQLGSRGHQYSLGLVEQNLDEVGFPTLLCSDGQRIDTGCARPWPMFARWDHQLVSSAQFNSFLDDIAAGNDLDEAYRLLADAYYLCHRSSPAELRHAALLGATACEVATQQLLRILANDDQRPLVDVILAERKISSTFILDNGCFAIKGRRLRDELPDVSSTATAVRRVVRG